MAGCFDGVIPPVIATCSRDGMPNASHLSQLYLVDASHVAISNQFFAKTAANLVENPVASVLVIDSQSYTTYRLSLRFERSETSGPTFEELRDSIDAIAALMDMRETFALRSADIYQVVSCECLGGPSRAG